MALPNLVKLAAVTQVERFCERRVPADMRDRVRLEFLVRGDSITIVERRRPWHPDYGPEWSSLKIAQFRYEPSRGEWSIYWRDRNERWFLYSEAASSRDLGQLLAEVESDPTGIFWG